MGGIEAAWLAGKTIKTLIGYVTSTNNYATFETPYGTDYVVPAAKKFKCLRVKFLSNTATILFGVSHGTAGVADGVGAPAGEIILINVGTTSPLTALTANVMYAQDLYLEFPTGVYPCLKTSVTSAVKHMILEGVEEA